MPADVATQTYILKPVRLCQEGSVCRFGEAYDYGISDLTAAAVPAAAIMPPLGATARRM
jgi:hypothetical protein